MSQKFRILVAGKSGAGKSSFCNYLVGEEHFKTGVGAPVTTWENNFQEAGIGDEDYQIRIADTVGIESGNTDRWLRELDSYSCKEKSNIDINDWVHSVLYFINAQAARIEEYDILTIERLRASFKNSAVIVVLTHYDTAGQESIERMKKELSNLKVPVCEVSSVSKRLRGGQTIEPSGKEVVVETLYQESLEKVFYRLNMAVLERLRYTLGKSEKRILECIDDADLSIRSVLKGESSLDEDIKLEEVLWEIEEQKINFSEQVEDYFSFIRRLDNNAENYLDLQGDLQQYNPNKAVQEVYDAMDEAALAFQNTLDDLAKQLESNRLSEQIKAVAKGVKIILWMKSTVKDGIKTVFWAGEQKITELTSEARSKFDRKSAFNLGMPILGLNMFGN